MRAEAVTEGSADTCDLPAVGFANTIGAIRILNRVRLPRSLAFIVCLVAFGFGPFEAGLRHADHFADDGAASWLPANVWLQSAECARLRHVWLAICSDDKLFPISDYAFGDDPGHALLLDVWAMSTDNVVTVADVARLNIEINIAGLVVLASFLFAIRAYMTSIVLLALGPVVFVGWIGVSPHWSFIGIASMTMVLPIAILAREYHFLPRWVGNAYVGLGVLGLSLAALAREAIGDMGLVTTICVLAAIAMHRRRSKGQWRRMLVVLPLVLGASVTPTLVTAARDASFTVEPAHRVARHGFADILFQGLGAVPNSLGISYEDRAAKEYAERVKPSVTYCSPEFYRIIRDRYFEIVMSEPAEVARIYFDKARLILADSILDSAPPLWIVLVIAATHFLVATTLGLWRRAGFSQGLLVEGAALVFICLFVAQAILANPSRFYAMPMGAALVVLLGVLLEFLGRSAVLWWSDGPTIHRATGVNIRL